MNKQQPDIELCHHLNEPQLLQLHKLYQNEWWSQKRKLADIRKMLAATDIIGAKIRNATPVDKGLTNLQDISILTGSK